MSCSSFPPFFDVHLLDQPQYVIRMPSILRSTLGGGCAHADQGYSHWYRFSCVFQAVFRPCDAG
jgi:hypothetical protein